MRNKAILMGAVLFCIAGANSQTIDSASISFSGYVDTYLAWYTDSTGVHDYQKFPTVSPRSGQFGLNIAQLTGKFNGSHARATVSLHYGDLPSSVWSTDFNLIQEANAGVKICDKAWIDAGFFRTHVGGEGLYPKENIASSISIPTWFEPYYEAGVKLNYQISEKVMLNLYALNGYNMFTDNNRKKSGGLLFTYTPSQYFNVGYNNYFGDDTPTDADSISHFHIYNNAFVNYEKNKLKILGSVDFCMQQNSDLDDADKSAMMFSGLFAIRYLLPAHFDIYARAEYFNDPDGFLSGVFPGHDAPSGLNIAGITAGVEYMPWSRSYIRLESRDLIADSDQDIFYWDGHFTNSRMEVLLNMGVWF